MTSEQPLAIFPAEERLGKGAGAISTWQQSVMANQAHAPEILAVDSPNSRFEWRLYRAYDRLVSWAALRLSRLTSRSTFAWRSIFLLRGRLWIRLNRSEILRRKMLHIHNRPEYVNWIRDWGFAGPIILHMHNELSQYGPAGADLRSAEIAIFCSDFIRREALEHASLPSTCVIHNGTAVSLAAGTQMDTRATDQVWRAAFVARLIPEKGLFEAISLCGLLNAAGMRTYLTVAGAVDSSGNVRTSDYVRKCREAADVINREYQIELITFIGFLDRTSLEEVLLRSHFLLSPVQWREPFGMNVLEAMGAGCVPVVAASGGIVEFVDEGFGYFVSPNPTATEAQAIADAGMEDWRTRSARAKLRAADFSWEVISRDVDAVYSGVTRDGPWPE